MQGQDTAASASELKWHNDIASAQKRLLSQAEEVCSQEGADSLHRTICMDLQQVLPCPKLRNQKAYYKKKVSLFNFCIYDLNQKRANCYLWDETIARKGSNEINSCLFKWVQENKSAGFKHLTIFSDNCVGQNKNLYVILNCMRLIQAGDLESITIQFMVAGHSYMPCDRTFGSIEKKIRNRPSIHCPDEYVTLISSFNFIDVFKMTTLDFFDFKALKTMVRERKPQGFNFTDGRTFKLTREDDWCYDISCHLGEDNVSLRAIRPPPKSRGKATQKSSCPLLSTHSLELAYPHGLKLDPSKLLHMRSLHGFLNNAGRNWLESLTTSQDSAQEFTQDEAELPDPEILQNPDLGQDQDHLFDSDVSRLPGDDADLFVENP